MKFRSQGSTLWILMKDSQQTANALTLADSRELKKHLKRPWKLIVCKGEERVFCSGGQLKDYAKLKSKEPGLKINNEIKKNLTDLLKHPALKIALVGGDCFGGGIEFLGSFDLIYCVPHALFGFWQNKMGVSYGWGGYVSLQKKLSATFLKTVLLEEKVCTAFDLKEAGLIHEILPLCEFDKIADTWEKALASKPSKFEIHKGLRSNAETTDLRSNANARALQNSADATFRKLWWAPEHRAILEKIQKD